MYETIKRIYAKTGNQDVVYKAVERGWISVREGESIMGMTAAPEGSPE